MIKAPITAKLTALQKRNSFVALGLENSYLKNEIIFFFQDIFERVQFFHLETIIIKFTSSKFNPHGEHFFATQIVIFS